MHPADLASELVHAPCSTVCACVCAPSAVPIERLRLPPPPVPSGWVPALGEPVEGLWNDCWWEGSVREFHVHKGILFQYDRWQYAPTPATPTHTHASIGATRHRAHVCVRGSVGGR